MNVLTEMIIMIVILNFIKDVSEEKGRNETIHSMSC